MLGGDDHGPNPLRHAVLVLDRHLGLAIGTEIGQLAGLAHLGEATRHAVGQGDRQRHELGRLAAGKSEHHPLVAGAELLERGGIVADLERGVDAHRDVLRLLLDADEGSAGEVVEPVVRARVADLPDRVAHDLLEVDVGRRRDLAEHCHEACRCRRLAGDPGVGIGLDDRVQDRVRDLVAHLVRVPFGHRLGREQVVGRVDDARHGAPRALTAPA